MLKVYFTASTTFDGKYKKNYRKIIALIKRRKYQITSGQQIVNKKLLEKDAGFSRKKIFEREFKRIDESDCVIAEVTYPSHGVGAEIIYALLHHKPVLGMVYKNNKEIISPMIAGNPSDNFFLEHYTLDRLKYLLKDFFTHIENQIHRKGKLIVIDGADGSGKTVQTRLLVKYLKNHKINTKKVDFPQYYSSFHGKTVAKFLRGEFGNIKQVSPYLASLAYALDRASVKKEMSDFLKKGGFIVANRYATSSFAHQGVKFKKGKERDNFLNWLYELEYKVHKIPKENLVIYLYVPWKMGIKLTQKKGKREYLNKKMKDIHEKNIRYRKNVEKMYINLSRKYKHWVSIDCVENKELLPPKKIHQKIVNLLKERKYIS